MNVTWVVAFVFLWAIVLLLSLLVLGLFRRVSDVLEQAEQRLRTSAPESASRGLPPGSRMPDFEAADAAGAPFRLSEFAARPVIYLFLSPDCEPCRLLLDDIGRRGVPDQTVRVVAIIEDTDEGRALELPNGVRAVYQRDESASRAFQTTATPHAFAVDENGVVVDTIIPNTVEHLRSLVESLRHGNGGEWKTEDVTNSTMQA